MFHVLCLHTFCAIISLKSYAEAGQITTTSTVYINIDAINFITLLQINNLKLFMQCAVTNFSAKCSNVCKTCHLNIMGIYSNCSFAFVNIWYHCILFQNAIATYTDVVPTCITILYHTIVLVLLLYYHSDSTFSLQWSLAAS